MYLNTVVRSSYRVVRGSWRISNSYATFSCGTVTNVGLKPRSIERLEELERSSVLLVHWIVQARDHWVQLFPRSSKRLSEFGDDLDSCCFSLSTRGRRCEAGLLVARRLKTLRE